MFQACTNQGFQSLVCNSKTNNEFLYYDVNQKGELKKKHPVALFLKISPSEVKSILVSVPSFNEQCLISEVLSESDSQIQSIENLIKKKRDIKKGTMQYLVSGKVRLPGFVDDWGSENLSTLCKTFTGLTGFAYGDTIKHYQESNIQITFHSFRTKILMGYLLTITPHFLFPMT